AKARTIDEDDDAIVFDVSSDRPSAAVLRSGRPLLLPSAVVVPLRAHGRTLGVLSLATSESHRRFGEDDLILAADLANRAALSVDTARLYEAEHQVAVTLQHSFLPEHLPAVPGL